MAERLIVGVSGASGAPLAVELLRQLHDNHPGTVDEMTRHTVQRILNQFGLGEDGYQWEGKERTVCGRWALALSRETGSCATVVCGIHYDDTTPEQIEKILYACDELLHEVLREPDKQ